MSLKTKQTSGQLPRNFKSGILKVSLFATGLAGIVAEYVLSTLATYFLGDSVVQFTMIVSVMLFSMGLGSRLSKYLEGNLLEKFIIIEFTLSIFSAFSALITYTAAAYTIYDGLIIYSLSIIIGILIGLEIPLVIRVNDAFEHLKINVSSVMEKDYYGCLLGGLFFAFVGLPYLGLTYTPFILGAINFLVAVALYFMVSKELTPDARKKLTFSAAGVGLILLAGVFLAKPIVLFGEQKRYKDQVIYERQTQYQKIVITQWQDDYWLYINGNQQLSTLDEVMYHEPLVHPAMKLNGHPQQVLVLGGGDGCAVREILKYPSVEQITLVDLDPVMTELGRTHPVFTRMNQHSLQNEKVKIINEDGFIFLEKTREYYDVIIVDLPDPKTVELGRLYSLEFYRLCKQHLRSHGVLVTQAGSPYYATKAFRCIEKTMAATGLQTAPLHNQVLTLGEWGWVLGVKNDQEISLKEVLQSLHYEDINTQWLNHEAMSLMTSFGKDFFIDARNSIEINTIQNPVLYRYYLDGNWSLY